MGAKYKAQQFIDAIPGSGGIVATIAKRVGCEWNTAKSWIENYQTVKQAYQDECETVSDMAESVLLTKIRDGDEATAKWWLSRIRRGKFATRQEMTGADGDGLNVILHWGDNADD